MRTGRFRVRKGWGNKSILQAEYDTPSFVGGRVDASLRQLKWEDVPFDQAPQIKSDFTEAQGK